MKALNDKKDLMQISWKINFQAYLLDYLGAGSDMEQMVQSGIKLFNLMYEFRQNCALHLREIVDEMCFPPGLRKHLPETVDDQQGVPSRLVFKNERYLTVLAIPEEASRLHLKEKNFEKEVVETGIVKSNSKETRPRARVPGTEHHARCHPRAG